MDGNGTKGNAGPTTRDWEQKKQDQTFQGESQAAEGRIGVSAPPRYICALGHGDNLSLVVGGLCFGPGARKIAGLNWCPSKPWLHKRLRRLPLYELILHTAGEDAFGMPLVDSSRHGHVLMENAKHGKVWVHDRVKHHAPASPDGRVVTSVVTKGTTGDSPIPGQLCAKTPKGLHRAMLPCRSGDNCQICGTGSLLSTRIKPERARVCGGTIHWRKGGIRAWPEECHFGAIRGRFVYCVRSVTLRVQELEPAAVSIRRNICA